MLGLKIKDGVVVGSHNGQRVVGIEFGVKLFWNRWYWRPQLPYFAGSLLWLCFRISWGWEYAFSHK